MEKTSAGRKPAHHNSSQTFTNEEARASLDVIARQLGERAFKPHPLFVNGHAQTLAAYAWPRRFSLVRTHRADQERIFMVEPGVSLLAHCRWQPDRRAHPTMILIHGLEGSSTSVYMLSTARKAYLAGFNVIRLNLRNCGGTEHLTPTLYNSGLSGDVRAIVRELSTVRHKSFEG